jgi:hypothetical protein
VTQVALLPVAYTTGGDFKPAKRPPVEDITYWDDVGGHRAGRPGRDGRAARGSSKSPGVRIPLPPLDSRRDGRAAECEALEKPWDASPRGFESLSLRRGRDDVYAQRWESLRSGKSGWSPALKGGFATDRGRPKEYLPLTDEVIEAHLAGRHHFGLYPLLRDDTCQLLVCDFDGEGWLLDALAYLDAARADGVPAALERSRSGDGGHVWSFFEGRLPAASARRIGAYLVREAMTVRAEIDLASYDRLFPSQDFLPRQGFGNLIALPLEGQRRKEAKTVF